MRIRALVSLLSVVLMGAALAGIAVHRESVRSGSAAARPNVLLVVIDTLRADHLGSYGYERDTSPYLDGLARGGTRFTTMRAPSSWTGASVASLLTGLAPLEHGVEHHNSVLPQARATMPEAFHNAGYETVAFSANSAFVTPKVGFGQGFERFDVLHGAHVARGEGLDTNWNDTSLRNLVEVATADQVTDAALQWLRERPDPDRPFFAYLHYFDPHAGYYPPALYAERFGVPDTSPLRGIAQKRLMYRHMRDTSDATAADLATLTALYDAEIAFTDVHVGRVLLELMARKIAPTIIVVTSDHGEEFGEHGGLQHSRTLFEELIEVPLIITGHGVAAGATVDDPVSLMDIWPILADLTGVALPTGLQTRSIRTITAGAPQPFFADLAVNWGIHASAVIEGPSKLILDRSATPSLFDLADDPGEHHELSHQAPARVEQLAATIRRRVARTRTSHTRTAAEHSTLTPARRARLEALGYLE